ncbi:GIY-YIG nuclease family protein [Luteibacter aegosomaticola]|uniref:GIY-YIG nuclease family protein n=1 Tax=Luteibacter aegosomaticola TaxID=2911538 RepID=UPI003CCDC246
MNDGWGHMIGSTTWSQNNSPRLSVRLSESSAGRGGIYIVEFEHADDAWFKVGSATHFRSRLSALQTGSPVRYRRMLVMDMTEPSRAVEAETAIHMALEDLRHAGEWFVGSLSPEVLARINAAVGALGIADGWRDVSFVGTTTSQAIERSRSLHARDVSARAAAAQREADREEADRLRAVEASQVTSAAAINAIYRGRRRPKN